MIIIMIIIQNAPKTRSGWSNMEYPGKAWRSFNLILRLPSAFSEESRWVDPWSTWLLLGPLGQCLCSWAVLESWVVPWLSSLHEFPLTSTYVWCSASFTEANLVLQDSGAIVRKNTTMLSSELRLISNRTQTLGLKPSSVTMYERREDKKQMWKTMRIVKQIMSTLMVLMNLRFP